MLTYLLNRNIVPYDFAIDVLLAHTTGDQLRVLRAEVEHEYALVRDLIRRFVWLRKVVLIMGIGGLRGKRAIIRGGRSDD